jgi:para-aminobenzoate synthetase component 1
MRKWITFTPRDKTLWNDQLITFCSCYNHSIILTNNQQLLPEPYNSLSSFNLLAGFDALETILCKASELKKRLKDDDWYLGFLSYELKNECLELPASNKKSFIEFPDLHFFKPRWLIRQKEGIWQIGFSEKNNTKTEALAIVHQIGHTNTSNSRISESKSTILASHNQKEYDTAFGKIQSHIQRGDIYELNFCIEFTAKDTSLRPAQTFKRLMQLSPMPLSAMLKYNNKYAFCASPERYMAKRGNKIVSMPMKGTAPRGGTKAENLEAHKRLSASQKEQSENTMITDLVRNDLSISALKGSVKVDELCGIYPFPNVFQMISTISSHLKNPEEWTAPLLDSFPMGSMTGAPKISAIKLIDQFECNKRGLFSGAIGYISPQRNFDFNVVIRTLLYDDEMKKISFWAGSAITAEANANDEYRECLLKAKIIGEKLL